MIEKEVGSAGDVGQRIRQLRREHGVAQSELAIAAGISQSTLSDMERGEIAGRSLETLARLARFFGVSADFLLGLQKETIGLPAQPQLSPRELELVRMVRELDAERANLVLRMAQTLHGDAVRLQRFRGLTNAIEAEGGAEQLQGKLDQLFALARDLGSVGAAVGVLTGRDVGGATPEREEPVEEA